MDMKLVKKIEKFYKKRAILLTLTIQDLKLKYAGSYLGFFWSLLEPLLVIFVYSLVFPLLLKMDFLEWVSFFLVGFISFRYLDRGIKNITQCLVEKADIVSKGGIHPELIVLSKCLSNLISFILESLIFLIIIFFFVKPTVYLLLYPLLVIAQTMYILGIGSYLSYHFPGMRDLIYILDVGFQLFFFLLPIIYRIEMIPREYRNLYLMNPFVRLIYLYQASVLYSFPFFKETLAILPNLIFVLVSSFIVFLTGWKLFVKHKYEAIGRLG